MFKFYSPKLFVTFIFLLIAGVALAQTRGTVRGRVFADKNDPIEAATVSLKGTRYGTTTDGEGDFSLHAPAGNYTLVISTIGMNSQEISITVTAGQTTNAGSITLKSSSKNLQEVNVSGSKTNKFVKRQSNDVAKVPLDNLENPQTYTTLTSQLVTEQQLTTVDAAVIRDAPGIQLMWNATGRGGDGGAYYNSRGFTVQSKLRNGIAGYVTNTTDAANIDQIEILKGPSATLFGSTLTSYGGLINRITKKPYDQVGGEVSYQVGSYNLNRVTADVNAPIDPGKKLMFRLNTAFNYQGSDRNNGFNRNVFIAPSLLYKPNDRLSISFDAELNYGTGSISPIYFFYYGSTIKDLGATNANQLNIDWRKSYFNSDLTETSHSANYFSEVKYKISNNWSSQTAFSYSQSYSNGFGPYFYMFKKDSVYREDQSTKNSYINIINVQENITGDFTIGGLRNRFVGGLDFLRQDSHQLYEEGYFDKESTVGHSADYYNNFNRAAMNAIYADPNGGTYPYPYNFQNNNYSAYALDVLNLTDRLIVLAALRADHINNIGSYSQNDFSPKFGLVYQLVKDQLSLYGNYQNGFTNENGKSFAGEAFKPEHANQWEGGVKANAFHGMLSATLSYYDINVSNVLRTDIDHPQFSIQDGTQRSRGIEAEVKANPFTGLNIVAGFAYNDSKYTKASPDVQGLRPATAGSPYQANFYASYRLPESVLKGLGFGFGGNYASNNKVVNSVSQGVFTLPEYTILNANAFYDARKYRFGVAVNNLTNKQWFTGYSSINPQMLRQFTATAAFKF